MPETLITPRDADKTWDRPTDDHHVFRLVRYHGYKLEVEDLHFHFDSAVLMPDYEVPEPTAEATHEHIAGLDILRACYVYAQQNPDWSILITGHTDTVGPAAYNQKLSDQRANSVYFALLGDRDNWVQTANQKNKPEDHKQLLKWVARVKGWSCDPDQVGSIVAGVRAFQGTYNREFSASIGVDGIIGPQTWGAFFDIYMEELARLLETDVPGLAQFRAALKFVSGGPTIGCGERAPIEAKDRPEYRSATNRRVEILFFESTDVPQQLSCLSGGGCTHPRCEISDHKTYLFEYLPPWPEEQPQSAPPASPAGASAAERQQGIGAEHTRVKSVSIDKRPKRIIHPCREPIEFTAVVEPSGLTGLIYRWYVDGKEHTVTTDAKLRTTFAPEDNRAGRRRDYQISVQVRERANGTGVSAKPIVVRVAQDTNVGTDNVDQSNEGLDVFGWTDTSPVQFDTELTEEEDRRTQTTFSLQRPVRSKVLDNGGTQCGRLQYYTGLTFARMFAFGIPGGPRPAALVLVKSLAFKWKREEFEAMLQHELRHCEHRAASVHSATLWRGLWELGFAEYFEPFSELAALFEYVQSSTVSYKFLLDSTVLFHLVEKYDECRKAMDALSADLHGQAKAMLQKYYDEAQYPELRAPASEEWEHHIDPP